MGVIVVIVLVLVAVGLVQAAIWIPITRSWRKRTEQFEVDFQAELVASGEHVLLGPEAANYRSCTGFYSTVSGNGTIVLTDRRLLFRKRSGGVVEVPVSKITGTRRSKSFQSSRVGGLTHLVVATDDPAELGYFVDDLDAWEAAIAAARPA